MTNALLFLIRTIADLFLLVLLLRFFLQQVRANFRNPLAQFVLKVTSPIITPLRRIIPSVGSIDTATIVVILLYEFLFVGALCYVFLPSATVYQIAAWSLIRLITVTLQFLVIAIFIHIIIGWIAPGTYNPLTDVLRTLVEPVLRPARRIVPTIGGLDLSPILVLLLLQAVIIAARDPLPGLIY